MVDKPKKPTKQKEKTLSEDPMGGEDFLNLLSSLGVSPDTLSVLLDQGESLPSGEDTTQTEEQTPTDNADLVNSLLNQAVNDTTGKGMDDDVPAQVDGQIPAALSEGEFVIPADVVSLLGDGNTDAGAKVLKDFMNKLRELKTGQKEQPKPTASVLEKALKKGK